ncbi:hypothetical protein CURTO8I2_250076 [Curtobacterium sp. 8I-2]|nr:hypothetical protein CURTO8I2_250076 [Curtobacterium sp. 8I-2]
MSSTLDQRVNDQLRLVSSEHEPLAAGTAQPVLTTPATVALGYAAVIGYAAEGAAFTAGATAVVGAYTVGRAAG